ncbi:MAG TPA: LysR family transcriptional regulator [Pseudolabrys sp.]|nr:LysR family transcriptional regulator [Pseudolabrys sp.]
MNSSNSGLDLNLLRVFDAVYQTGSVTRAASLIGLSQPAISHALTRLRRSLKDPLFIRSPQGMLPSARADEIYDAIHRALSLVDNCVSNAGFDPSREIRTFILGMNDISEVVFLPALMNHLKEVAPGIKIRTEHLSAEEVVDGLRSGAIDLAVGFLPSSLDEDFQAKILFEEHYVCMVNARHSVARRRRLNKRDFLQSAHAVVGTENSGHVLAENLLTQLRLEGRIVLRVPHFLTIPLIVAQNDLIVTVPSRLGLAISTHVDVRLLPYPEKIPSFPVSICWHAREEINPENRWLRETFVSLFRDGSPPQRPRASRRS